jgi:cellulose synthase/poly-beta-1,6-N-acetylglucosamine synthase-like glycosyltransferase
MSTLTPILSAIMTAFQWAVLAYFLLFTTLYFALILVGFVEMLKQGALRRGRHDSAALAASGLTPPVSLLATAYKEELTITESVRSLLSLSYPEMEVIVINDGSKDNTLAILTQEFRLYRSARQPIGQIPCKQIRGIYKSMLPIPLIVVDKVNGGKADALNAGTNVARYPLVCAVDADSLLERDALLRMVRPFLDAPGEVLAVGGIVRIVNGCKVSCGRVLEVDLPKSWVARFQIVEYMRAFLGGRLAFSAANALLIISGAFGLFNKSALLAVGGWDATTIGEDMELIVRLHRWACEKKHKYRIVFEPDPVCWTEAPEKLRSLRGQRNRWQRGTVESLWRHRGMIGRRGYGAVGWLAIPYFLLFEILGAVLESLGYVVTVVGGVTGLVDLRLTGLFLIVAILNGVIISAACVVLEELSTQKYPRVRNLMILLAAAVLENLGYRQVITFWRLQGLIDVARGGKGWGHMERKGFQSAPAPASR